MDTPIYDFVTRYARSDFSRLHMPGHKGVSRLGIEARDITEIDGADVLYDCGGIIRQSEENAAVLFSTGRTVYSTEGSSHVIKAMLYLSLMRARREGYTGRGVILAARNVHKSFIHACALLDIDVEWIYPSGEVSSICSCHPTAQQIKKSLSGMERRPFAVYLTSPDYLGYAADIAAISKVCGDIPLLVDNAHGAYLHFLPTPRHPIDLGAYMCADSAHKTLPVLTGGAYLQMSRQAAVELGADADAAFSLFGSTSPSYLILQSLDLANACLAGDYRERLAETVEKISALKEQLRAKYICVADSEPLKLVIDTSSLGMTGSELADYLRQYSIEAEFADVGCLVLMFTPDNSKRDFVRLRNALLGIRARRMLVRAPSFKLSPLRRAMSIREAIFSPHELISVHDSTGRVCALPSVSCPPAVPIAVSGEVIDDKAAELFCAYGIETVSVVK